MGHDKQDLFALWSQLEDDLGGPVGRRGIAHQPEEERHRGHRPWDCSAGFEIDRNQRGPNALLDQGEANRFA